MTTLKIPSPLRTYTDGQTTVEVKGKTVSEALESLVEQHPDLRQHLFNGAHELRPFVNLFLNSEDIRHLQNLATPIHEDDRLMIVPSIAGGGSLVDHSAIRTNQALIILLSVIAFILNLPWLVVLVAFGMAVGTALKFPGFGFVYRWFLKPLNLIKPDLLEDNPEPHRFAQGFGAVVLAIGAIALLTGASILGWGLVWLVILLAGLNLFVGFCVGCAMYYWLGRLEVPGFVRSPPENTIPGMRPKAKA
ncbi:MAG: ubiquitin-like small modifier protein 1 [Anaerolineales bacterium]